MPETLLPVIPAPARVCPKTGHFTIDGDTTITAPDPLRGSALFLQRVLREESALSLQVESGGRDNTVALELDPAYQEAGDEGYRLSVDGRSITIRAKTGAGAFYGVQTLRQLIPQTEGGSQLDRISVPCMEILDAPRFPWRGFMLDVARHFFDAGTAGQPAAEKSFAKVAEDLRIKS